MNKEELIKVLRSIEQSTEIINVDGKYEKRTVFKDENAFKLFGVMNEGILNPYNDHTYKWLSESIMDIVYYIEDEDNKNLDNFDIYQVAESLLDIYNTDLLKWLASNLDNMSYIDEALQETDIKDGFKLITYAQEKAICEFLNNLVNKINNILED